MNMFTNSTSFNNASGLGPLPGAVVAGLSRREFLKLAIATGVAVGAGTQAWAAEATSGMRYRTLGRTGEKVSVIGLGGFHIGQPPDERESIRIIRSAIDGGINFMECGCWRWPRPTSSGSTRCRCRST